MMIRAPTLRYEAESADAPAASSIRQSCADATYAPSDACELLGLRAITARRRRRDAGRPARFPRSFDIVRAAGEARALMRRFAGRKTAAARQSASGENSARPERPSKMLPASRAKAPRLRHAADPREPNGRCQCVPPQDFARVLDGSYRSRSHEYRAAMRAIAERARGPAGRRHAHGLMRIHAN